MYYGSVKNSHFLVVSELLLRKNDVDGTITSFLQARKSQDSAKYSIEFPKGDMKAAVEAFEFMSAKGKKAVGAVATLHVGMHRYLGCEQGAEVVICGYYRS